MNYLWRTTEEEKCGYQDNFLQPWDLCHLNSSYKTTGQCDNIKINQGNGKELRIIPCAIQRRQRTRFAGRNRAFLFRNSCQRLLLRALHHSRKMNSHSKFEHPNKGTILCMWSNGPKLVHTFLLAILYNFYYLTGVGHIYMQQWLGHYTHSLSPSLFTLSKVCSFKMLCWRYVYKTDI